VKSVFKPDLPEAAELRVARVAAGFAVIVAGVFGVYPPGFVAQVVAFAFGLAAASFFPVLVLGIFSVRTSREGAVAGMLTGILFTAAYIIYFRFFNRAAGPSEWLLGSSPEGIGTLGMLINFAVTLAVTRFTPPPPPEVQDMVEEIRLPRAPTSPPVEL
jgi:cation/acetate symporter